MNIAFSPPDIGEEEINEVVDTLRSGWITTGPKTKKFESEIASFCGTSRAVCLSSATAGLELVLRLFGVGEGDEVITSAYTYTASASIIDHVGARVVLADTGKDSFEMDYDNLVGLINERTKAIIPVDYAGVICNYSLLFGILDSKKELFRPKTPMQERLGRVLVLGDAAHSFGASRNSIMSGAHADFTAFSFHAVKSFTTAEGGAVTWTDLIADYDEIYRQFMLLSLHGQTKDALSKTSAGAWEYDIVAPYYKYNMTDIMASIGLAQLRRYEGILKRRAEIVDMYNKLLDVDDFSILRHTGDDFDSCKHLYIVRIMNKGECFRNKVIEKMGEAGIATNVHFKPLPMLAAYRNLGFEIDDYPNAFSQYENCISLPLYSLLTDDEVYYITDNFCRIVRELQSGTGTDYA